MMAYLFIGGVKDGERMKVPEHERHVRIGFVPDYEEMTQNFAAKWPDSIGQSTPMPIQHHVYRRRVLEGGINVFALDCMNQCAVMQALVQNYNPKGE